MGTKLAQTIERLVVTITVIAGIALAASRFGYLPESLSEPAFWIVIVGAVAEAGWRLFGQRVWRENVVKGLIQRDVERASMEMAGISKCEIRVCLMRPTGMWRKTLRVTSSSQNMYLDRDRGVRLEKWQGCAGKCWGHGKPVLADLTLPPQEGGPDWSMTPDLIDLTKDIKSVLSYPIFIPESGSTLYGVINFDAKQGVANRIGGSQGLDLADRHATAISFIIQATM